MTKGTFLDSQQFVKVTLLFNPYKLTYSSSEKKDSVENSKNLGRLKMTAKAEKGNMYPKRAPSKDQQLEGDTRILEDRGTIVERF